MVQMRVLASPRSASIVGGGREGGEEKRGRGEAKLYILDKCQGTPSFSGEHRLLEEM